MEIGCRNHRDSFIGFDTACIANPVSSTALIENNPAMVCTGLLTLASGNRKPIDHSDSDDKSVSRLGLD